GRAAVIAHTPRHLVGGKPILECGGREQRGRAKQVVPAAMSVARARHRPRFGNARLLAQAGQRVVFAQDRNDRPAFARLADDGGWNARDILLEPETLALELLDVFGNRAMLGILQFGHAPDAVAQRLISVLTGVDQAPDFFGIDFRRHRNLHVVKLAIVLLHIDQSDPFGDERRAILAFDLDGAFARDREPASLGLDRDELHAHPDFAAGRNHAGEAELVEAVIDAALDV